MYSRVVPMPGDTNQSEDAPIYDESKDACNPENFTDDNFDEEIIIKAK